mmetsp:Transcript_57616/g.136992  ORF Transcript_57616/g.136992 Transcript_57616/m.136992 type:complete len:538 (-) Transcript_57616:22-1635(-)
MLMAQLAPPQVAPLQQVPRLRLSGSVPGELGSCGESHSDERDDAASEGALDSPHLFKSGTIEDDLPRRWGPAEVPDLLQWLPDSYLGAGSTAKVHMSVCRKKIDKHAPFSGKFGQGWFRVYNSIADGEKVAVKFHAYGYDLIGSSSNTGPSPSNYPTKFATGVRERLVGSRLCAQGEEHKDHCVALLASWLDERGIWLVYRLGPDAATLHQVLAPESELRLDFSGRPLAKMSAIFQQCVKALMHLAECGVVHRDGGLENWLISDPSSSAPKPVLIDYGLAVVSSDMYTASDSVETLLQYLHQSETGQKAEPGELAAACTTQEGMSAEMAARVSPIDWLYSPGAAGPKFPPPPELRIVKEELPLSRLNDLDELSRCGFTVYLPGYDVWILSWTFLQIMLAQRWADWRTEDVESRADGSTQKDTRLQQLVRSMFYDRRLLVPVEWELKDAPPAWRLGILAEGQDVFQTRFLNCFFQCAEEKLSQAGSCTPLQTEFLRVSGTLRRVLGRMLDFEARQRQVYLVSGSLHDDLEQLGRTDSE